MEKKLPLIVVSLLSLVLFASRILPHQPNFTPVLALCLFSGFFAKGRWYGVVLPMAALLLSDWQIGFYPGWGFNYISLVLLVLAGMFLKGRASSFLTFGFLGATVFFLLSNLGVWYFTQLYPFTFDGLLQCYTLGILFFKATLLSTTSYMLIFYGAYVAVRQHLPQGSLEKA